IKVMNLVSLLIAPAIVQLSVGENASDAARLIISLVAVAIIVVAIVVSKRRSSSLSDSSPAQQAANVGSPDSTLDGPSGPLNAAWTPRSEEHTSELQS